MVAVLPTTRHDCHFSDCCSCSNHIELIVRLNFRASLTSDNQRFRSVMIAVNLHRHETPSAISNLLRSHRPVKFTQCVRPRCHDIGLFPVANDLVGIVAIIGVNFPCPIASSSCVRCKIESEN